MQSPTAEKTQGLLRSWRRAGMGDAQKIVVSIIMEYVDTDLQWT